MLPSVKIFLKFLIRKRIGMLNPINSEVKNQFPPKKTKDGVFTSYEV
jgi:hypothetical protein